MKNLFKTFSALLLLISLKAGAVGVEPLIKGDGIYIGEAPYSLEIKFTPDSSAEAGKHLVEVAWVRDLSLMYDRDTVYFHVRNVALTDGESTIESFKFSLEPGFYQVCVSVDGQMKNFNIGIEPEKIVSEQTKHDDFDAFWEANLQELASVPMDATLTLMPEMSDEHRNVYRVEYKSLGGVVVGGILAEPVAEGKYPVFVEYMGYGSDVYPYWGGNNVDRIEFLASVRDQGLFRDCQSGENGHWITRGIEDKNDFYYRGAFCDVVRAVDFVCSREKADLDNVYALGESQGGAFTWISASLDKRISGISVAVPFLSDYSDYQKIVWWPVWEVFEVADAKGIARTDVLDMMSYFDIMNFTDRIECPVYMAVGLQDPTCPPHTNFAGYNNVKTEKHYHCVPTCGHAMWQEQSWKDIKAAWFQKLLSAEK